MSKPVRLKKGDLLVCTHYRTKPLVKFIEYHNEEVWVREVHPPSWLASGTFSWWGPRDWFRKLPRKGK